MRTAPPAPPGPVIVPVNVQWYSGDCQDPYVDVQRICFLGTRTSDFDVTSAFFRDVLGLPSVHAEIGWSVFRLPSGRSDYVEVFGPGYENASVFPAEVSEGIVVAFAVDD